MYTFNINEMSAKIHADNVAAGWWPEGQCLTEKLQLISTEIAEATEGARKDLMDDHLPTRKMFEVELADTLIRLFDFAGHVKIEIPTLNEYYFAAVDNMMDTMRPNTIGSQLFNLNIDLVRFALALSSDKADEVVMVYAEFLVKVAAINSLHGLDVVGAMHEKLAYNQKRADHKLENRAKDGGKKF